MLAKPVGLRLERERGGRCDLVLAATGGWAASGAVSQGDGTTEGGRRSLNLVISHMYLLLQHSTNRFRVRW
ncbi:uncharacterized protein MONOS_17447 [Monocercomonoides exilis]|uniref:uncharacterized protein n=1 Tax=Monocercomonoides exilis TaxID=2049356 RepID=UPI00355A73B3|nr:hypothetical protein MONOS_17447 [Monocercomonoides exilis]